MTHFFTILCGLNAYVSLTFKYNDLHFENPTTAKTNI